MKAQYILPLAALSATIASIAPAQAATSYRIFVLINGTPTDVTAAATIGGGHVFLNSNWIGTLNSSNQIIDENDEMVGYLVPDEPPFRLTYSPWKK